MALLCTTPDPLYSPGDTEADVLARVVAVAPPLSQSTRATLSALLRGAR